MTPTPTDLLMEFAANGNVSAQEFLVVWNLYCHAIDDLVDGTERPEPEVLLGVFAQAATLYAHPFYRQHATSLLPVVLLVTSTYADSVKMEKLEGWPSAVADVLRFCGNDLVCTVAMITGGYAHMREVSGKLRAVSQYEHHDAEGQPT